MIVNRLEMREKVAELFAKLMNLPKPVEEDATHQRVAAENSQTTDPVDGTTDEAIEQDASDKA